MKLTGGPEGETLFLSIRYDDIPDDAERAPVQPTPTSRFDDLRKAKAKRSNTRSDVARKAAGVLRNNTDNHSRRNERVRLDRAKQQYLGAPQCDDRRNEHGQADEADSGGLS